VRKAVAITSLLLALSACADWPASDQIAQHAMIGLSKKRILACMGRPARRDVVGTTQIWTYPAGNLRTIGPPWAIGLNLAAPPFGSTGACDVKFDFTNAEVTQVTYAAPGGGDPPLGEQCAFAVQNCVSP